MHWKEFFKRRKLKIIVGFVLALIHFFFIWRMSFCTDVGICPPSDQIGTAIFFFIVTFGLFYGSYSLFEYLSNKFSNKNVIAIILGIILLIIFIIYYLSLFLLFQHF